MKKILIISYLLLSTNLFADNCQRLMLNSKDSLIVNCTSQVHGTINNVKSKDIALNGNYISCSKAGHFYFEDKKNLKKFTKRDYKLFLCGKEVGRYCGCDYAIKQGNKEFYIRGAKLFSNIKEGDNVKVKLKVFQIYTNDRKVHNVAVITDMKKRK